MQQQTAELEKLTDTVAKFTAVISRRLPDAWSSSTSASPCRSLHCTCRLRASR